MAYAYPSLRHFPLSERVCCYRCMYSEQHLASAPATPVERRDSTLKTRPSSYNGTVTFLLILSQSVYKLVSVQLKFCNFLQGPQLRKVTECYGTLQIASKEAGVQACGGQELELKPGGLGPSYTLWNFVTLCAAPISVT